MAESRSLASPRITFLAFVLLFLGVAGWIVSIRALPAETLVRLLFVIQTLLTAGGIGLLWLASAMGWGRLARPLLREATHPFILQLGCGIATLLWLEHLLGWMGALARAPVSWVLAGVGIGLLLHQIRGFELRTAAMPRLPGPALLLAPPLAILAVAASSMPGWLWDSENFGFDTLEYHLQLPAEWLASGRISNLDHNVYSCLPGYLEAAYLHIGAAFGSVHAAGGIVLLAAQWLNAVLTVTLALAAGVFVAARIRERGDAQRAAFAGALAAAAILSVPFAQVVGSLAYDEMAMNMLLLAGIVAALDARLNPLCRGVLVGWLSGVASGVKLSGLFMVAAPLILLLLLRPRERRAAVLAGMVGFAALLPYFVRNVLGSGSPLFPFATRLFRSGHWSVDQLARWSAAHRFAGTLGQRLSFAWQGLAHPLWSLFFFLLLMAVLLALLVVDLRTVVVPLVLVLAVQLLSWMFLTHLLARFLLPLLPAAGVLIGIAAGSVRDRAGSVARRALLASLCLFAIVPLTAASLANISGQRRGNPAVFVGPDAFDLRTGGYYLEHQDQLADAPIEYTTNFALPPGSRVYFIGESRVLYAMGPKIYNTAWDRSALGDLMRRHPGEPARWASGLRDLGVTHLRVSLTELDRIQRVEGISDPLVSLTTVERFLAVYGRPLARKEGISGIYELRTGESEDGPPR